MYARVEKLKNMEDTAHWLFYNNKTQIAMNYPIPYKKNG